MKLLIVKKKTIRTGKDDSSRPSRAAENPAPFPTRQRGGAPPPAAPPAPLHHLDLPNTDPVADSLVPQLTLNKSPS